MTKSYATNFDLTETPISENGTWVPHAASWTALISSGGNAIDSQDNSGAFDDSNTCLRGFPPDQRASGIIHKGATSGGMEAELLLRWDIDAAGNLTRGYECNLHQAGNYAEIVRWNGGLGSFNYVKHVDNVATPADGDTFSAEIVGNQIRTYLNGVILATGDIGSIGGTVWGDGNPGVGMFRHTGAASSTYGFQSYAAQGLDYRSVRHTNGDYLTHATMPAVTGDWVLGIWVKCSAAEYGGAGEHIVLYMGNSGASNECVAIDVGVTNNTTLSVLALNLLGNLQKVDIATGSDTGWIFVSIQHVSGSASYTVRWRREKQNTFRTSVLTLSAQILIATGGGLWIGTDKQLEYAVDSDTRGFFCQETTMTDAQLLAASRKVDTAPAGTNLHFLALSDACNSPEVNGGTAGNWTIGGTLQTDASGPDASSPSILTIGGNLAPASRR